MFALLKNSLVDSPRVIFAFLTFDCWCREVVEADSRL